MEGRALTLDAERCDALVDCVQGILYLRVSVSALLPTPGAFPVPVWLDHWRKLTDLHQLAAAVCVSTNAYSVAAVVATELTWARKW